MYYFILLDIIGYGVNKVQLINFSGNVIKECDFYFNIMELERSF